MAIDEGYYIKLGATFDASGIAEAQSAVGKLAGDLQGTMASASAAMDSAAASAGRVGDALSTIGGGAGGGLDELRAGFKKATTDIDSLIDATEKAETELGKLGGAGGQARDELGRFTAEAKTGMAAFADAAEEAGRKLTALGGALTGTVTASIAAFGAVAFKAFTETDNAMDALRVKTGATGDELSKLGASLDRIAVDAPVRIGQLGAAMGDVASKLQITGPALEEVTLQFARLADATGENLPALIAGVSRAFKDAGVPAEQMSFAMDKLLRVSQATGQGIGQLAASMANYGTPLRQLGFDFDSTALLIGKFNQEGVRGELVLGAMRMALNKFTAAGMEPVKAFNDIVAQIKSLSIEQGNLLAKQVVGARAAADFAGAIREGRFEIEKQVAAIRASGDSVKQASKDTSDFAQAWIKFSNALDIALKPLGGALNAALQDLVAAIQPLIGFLADLAQWFADLSPATQTWIIALAALAAAVGPVVVALGLFISSIGTITAALPGIAAALGTGATGLAGLLGRLVPAIAAVTVAWGAWNLGTWLRDNNPRIRAFGDALGDLLVKIPGVEAAILRITGASRSMTDANTSLAGSVAMLEAKLKAQGVVIQRGNMSLEEYAAALRRAAIQHAPLAQATTQAAAGTTALSTAARTGGISLDTFAKHADSAGKAVAAAGTKVSTAVRAISEEAKKLNLDDAFRKMQAAVEAATPSVAKLAQELLKLDSFKTVMAAGTKDAVDAAKAWRDIDDAAKKFGITLKSDVIANFDKLSTQFDVIVKLYREGKISTEEFAKAQLKLAESSLQAAIAGGKSAEEIANIKGAVDRAKEALGEFQPAIAKVSQNFLNLQSDLKQVWGNFKADIAEAVIHWQGFGAAGKAVLISIKDAALKYLVNEMMDSIATSLLKGQGLFKQFGDFVSNIFKSITKGLSSLFGGGAEAAGGAVGAGGGAGGALGGLGAGLGSVTSIVGVVGSVVSAITGVLSYLNSRRMEQDIGRIEVTMREVKAELMNLRADEWTRETHWYARTSDILDAINRFGDAIGGYLSEMLGNLQQLAQGAGGSTRTDELLSSLDLGMREGFRDVVSWLQQSNRILVEIASATAFTAQAISKPDFRVSVANFPASQLQPQGPRNEVNLVNPTFSSFTPQQLGNEVMRVISQSLGRR